jgi:predicted molibdopterin-dependent oxidoreductase YjgC
VADIVLPLAHHAEKDGTFVNVEWRLQRFEKAFPPPGQVRSGVEVLSDLLTRFDPRWAGLGAAASAFDHMAADLPALAGLTWETLPATGSPLNVPSAEPAGTADAATQEAGLG